MTEKIKRITSDDLEESLLNWKCGGREPKFFLVNTIDIMDWAKPKIKEYEQAHVPIIDLRIFYRGIQIIRSDDIPHGEIYVV